MDDWDRRYWAHAAGVFERALHRVRNRPLDRGDVVVWRDDTGRINDRAMELVACGDDGSVTIQGFIDGDAVRPRLMNVPKGQLVRAQDFFDIATDVSIEHGECACGDEPGTRNRQ